MSVSRCVLTSNYSSPVIPHRSLVLSLPLISPSPTSLSLPSSLSVSFVSLLSPPFTPHPSFLFSSALFSSFLPSFSHSFSFVWHLFSSPPFLAHFSHSAKPVSVYLQSFHLSPRNFFFSSSTLLRLSPSFSSTSFHHHPIFHVCPLSLPFFLFDFSLPSHLSFYPLPFLLSISTVSPLFSPPLPPFHSFIHRIYLLMQHHCPLPPIWASWSGDPNRTRTSSIHPSSLLSFSFSVSICPPLEGASSISITVFSPFILCSLVFPPSPPLFLRLPFLYLFDFLACRCRSSSSHTPNTHFLPCDLPAVVSLHNNSIPPFLSSSSLSPLTCTFYTFPPFLSPAHVIFSSLTSFCYPSPTSLPPPCCPTLFSSPPPPPPRLIRSSCSV